MFFSTFWNPLRSISTVTPTDFHHQQLIHTVVGMLETSISSPLHLVFGTWGLELGHHEVIRMFKKIINPSLNVSMKIICIFTPFLKIFTLIVYEKLVFACWKVQVEANQCNFVWALAVTRGKNRQALLSALGNIGPETGKLYWALWDASPRTCAIQLSHLNLAHVQSRLRAQRLRIPGEHPWALKPCFCFNLPGGSSPIPRFPKLQNGVNELISVGLMFAFTSTDEKCDMRAVGDCYYQGATYLHWNKIGERRIGSAWWVFCWRACLKLEGFMWYPASMYGEGYTRARAISG